VDRRFLTVWAGQLVSTLGTSISSFGAAVWVFIETDSLLWLSILAALATLPSLLAAPLTGVIDRFDRRLIMIAADAAAALVTAALVVVLLVAELQPWHLALGMFLAGFASSFQQPAYEAAIASLVDGDDLGRANGLVQLGPSMAVVVAPGLAGLLLVWGGVGAIFAVDLISFVVALLALVLARFSAPPTDAGVGVGEDGDSPAAVNDTYRLQDAARWVWNHARPIARLIGAMAIINFFLAIFNVSVIARGTILGGEAGAGIAPTVGGVTMLGASLVIAARGIPQRRMQALMLALVAFGCASMLAVAGPSLLLLSVGVGLAMITAPVAQTIVTTTFQEQVKTSMQGRVFGLRNAVGRGTYPLGALVAGPVAARSIPGAFAVVGVAMVLTGLLVGLSAGLRPIDAAPSKSV
jgi:MFS family permease